MITRVAFILVFFIANITFAQQADRIQRGQRGYVPQPKNFNYRTPVSLKDPIKETTKIVTICKEKFQLDDFQSEILKSLTHAKVEQENTILLNKEFDASLRHKALLALEKQYFLDLTETGVFSEEEVEAMKLMDFDNLGKDAKKEKKSKKKKGKKRSKS